METLYNLREAAQMLGWRDWRTVRLWMHRAGIMPTKHDHDKRHWLLTAEQVDGVRRYRAEHRREPVTVREDLLARLTGRIEALEARVRALEGRETLADLADVPLTPRRPQRPVARTEGQRDRAPQPERRIPARKAPVTRPLTSWERRIDTLQAPGTFKTHQDAAVWLVKHGIGSPSTPKDWPHWRETELTQRAMLELALQLKREAEQTHNWRVRASLMRCSTPDCVCHELLTERSTPTPSPVD